MLVLLDFKIMSLDYVVYSIPDVRIRNRARLETIYIKYDHVNTSTNLSR